MLIADCKECTFRVTNILENSTSHFRCRRYPPLAVPLPSFGIDYRFPEVDEGNWCGEFRPIKKQSWKFPLPFIGKF